MKNQTLIVIILITIVIGLLIIGWGATQSKNLSPDEFINNNYTQNKMTNLITLETSLGQIQFETYNDDTPQTVANFIKLAQDGFYDGLIFHRVIKGFMIQGGDPYCQVTANTENPAQVCGTGGPGYQFNDELNPQTLSYQTGYQKGVVAMANAGPNTNGSQFFIMLEDTPLPNAYTIFGRVVKGQEIVDKIGQVETNENDRPKEAIIIKEIKVEEGNS